MARRYAGRIEVVWGDRRAPAAAVGRLIDRLGPALLRREAAAH